MMIMKKFNLSFDIFFSQVKNSKGEYIAKGILIYNPDNYPGTAIINGKKITTNRGPAFDMYYVLSNYLKFDIEISEITNRDVPRFIPLGQKEVSEHKA